MLTEIVRAIIHRYLTQLGQELTAYRNEADIWEVVPGISNSAGNLALHLAGNLQAFIGAALGNTGYIRNREAEFSLKNIPLSQLLQEIATAEVVVEKTLVGLNKEDIEKYFPIKIGDEEKTTEYMLVHLASHLSYHVGQINYHRRILDTK